MICCTLIALLLAAIGWSARKMAPVLFAPEDALAWRLVPHNTTGIQIQPTVMENDKVIRSFWAGRIKSFGHAFDGLRYVIANEINMQLHLAIAIGVVALGFMVDLDWVAWCWIVLAMGMVLAAETFNTAIEQFCDRLVPEHDPLVAVVKDVSAAAVLITAFTAALVGIFVFIGAMDTSICYGSGN